MRYVITTPEQVRFSLPIAGLASRAVAWTVDQLILWALRLVVLLELGNTGEVGVAMVLLLIFGVDFGYYVVFELMQGGRSPGKRWMALRVVSARGGRLTFADVMIRNLLRPVDTLPFAMTLGGLVAWADPLGRRLGDMAAETLVIRDVRGRVPQEGAADPRRANSFAADAALRQRVLARVSREDRDLIYDLAMRRDTLDPGVRERLFADAAALYRRKFALPEEGTAHLSDEQTVLNLAMMLRGATFKA